MTDPGSCAHRCRRRRRRRTLGSQTLDRGIRALVMVAAAPGGLTVQEVADRLEVHRTIAHRLLATLADHHLIARGPDNRFRAGGGLTALAGGVQSTLRDTADADHARAGRRAASRPSRCWSGRARRWSRSPWPHRPKPPTTWPFAPVAGTRSAAARPASACCRRCRLGPGERPEVTRARTQGFSVSKGEVEPGAHGLAVLIHQGGDVPSACLNLITYRDDVMARAAPVMLDGATRISALLS